MTASMCPPPDATRWEKLKWKWKHTTYRWSVLYLVSINTAIFIEVTKNGGHT